MTLLRDRELYDRLTNGTIVIDGMSDITGSNWASKSSPIQPSSIDLHIGQIFIPRTQTGELGSEGKPRTECSLATGHMAVITTLETIHLPANIAAIGFPPSHVSMADF